MRLIQDASDCAHRNFRFFRNDGGVNDIALPADKLDVAAPLADFNEPCSFQPALDLAKG